MYPSWSAQRDNVSIPSPGHAWFRRYALAVLVTSLAIPAVSNAADAHKGVHAKPGEMVLLRDVPTRPAVRRAPPGLALIVDPKPNAQLNAALGGMEISDREAGAISAPVQANMRMLTTVLAGTTVPATRTTGGQNTPPQPSPNTGPLGAVGSATRNVGSQVTGALQALPLGKPAGG